MDAYTPIADAYGTLTADYDYDRWLDVIEQLAHDAGVHGTRLLDVACGTGSSFLPLCDRYDVVACDLSRGMLEQAAARAAGHPVRLLRHDMRELPELGEFDLVLCLDDALNHLLEPQDVLATLRGIASNLAPDGVAVFDVNTLAALRAFEGAHVAEDDRYLVLWRGTGSADLAPGGRTGAQVDVLARSGDLYARHTTMLRERHYPVPDVCDYLALAGLEVVQLLGQSTGVHLARDVDELRQHKALFVVRRAAGARSAARAA